MTFALCLQVPNHLHFKKPVDIWAGFVPQMIFLQSIFGYLVVCILYKWSVDWSKSSVPAPSLLTMIINMFLSPGDVQTPLYPGQAFVQGVLLLAAAACIPVLLVVKPYIEWQDMKRIQQQGYVGLHNGDDGRDSRDLEGEEEGNARAILEREQMEEEAEVRI